MLTVMYLACFITSRMCPLLPHLSLLRYPRMCLLNSQLLHQRPHGKSLQLVISHDLKLTLTHIWQVCFVIHSPWRMLPNHRATFFCRSEPLVTDAAHTKSSASAHLQQRGPHLLATDAHGPKRSATLDAADRRVGKTILTHRLSHRSRCPTFQPLC